jgi:ABC-type lipoprotein export system ATPase subunit
MSAVLGYEPLAHDEAPERVWVEAPGCHSVSCAYREELLEALHRLEPRPGARLVLLGADVGALARAERLALRGRVGFVPAGGGLLSSLNAWENISLPVAYHAPQRLPALGAEVRELLAELGGVDEGLLGKLPENMTLYERRLAACIRAVLEDPALLVAENLSAGLGPTKRRRVARFADAYRRRCPGGTFVQFDG